MATSRFLSFILISVAMWVGGTRPASADAIDEAEAKRRGVSVERIQLDHAKEQITSLQSKIDALQKQLAEASTRIDAQRVELLNARTDTEASKKDLAAAKSEVAKLTPGNALASAESPEVNTARLETTGEKYENKVVRMIGVKFNDVDNSSVDLLPGITLASNGLVSRIDTRELEKWIGLSIVDKEGKLFLHVYALKAEYGEILVTLKRGRRINLQGTVVALDQPGWYGLVCSKIEIVPDVDTDPNLPTIPSRGRGSRGR
jgi:exonuclease VII large subunit